MGIMLPITASVLFGVGQLGDALGARQRAGNSAAVKVEDHDDFLLIDTDQLQARINKKGYVSGVAAGSFLDKKTGARDLGFGLHIMDFLMAPGWRDDGYPRDAKIHGNLPKHYVEGPQICTKARQLDPEVVRGPRGVMVRLHFAFTQPGSGFKAGSKWVQTLLFMPGVRYFLSAEQITSANDVKDLFYRIDMPGHIKQRDRLARIYLSYHGEIAPEAFTDNFGPDDRFLYQRQNKAVPKRMIRAYQVKVGEKPGPWLAGITLDPAEVSEAWCHQRGYVCMIQENHRRSVKAGATFGAAYVVGWFNNVSEMEKASDRLKGLWTVDGLIR
jgi:hypothetical protein